MSDIINHPEHYTSGQYEVIDIIKSVLNSMDITPYQGYLLGNELKYLCRFPHKGGAVDLHKAKWYLEKLISEVI